MPVYRQARASVTAKQEPFAAGAYRLGSVETPGSTLSTDPAKQSIAPLIWAGVAVVVGLGACAYFCARSARHGKRLDGSDTGDVGDVGKVELTRSVPAL